MFKKAASLNAPFDQKLHQNPTAFASAWPGFSRLLLLLFKLDLMLARVQGELLTERLEADWYAEVDTHRRWRRRCFVLFSSLRHADMSCYRGGGIVTFIDKLDR